MSRLSRTRRRREMYIGDARLCVCVSVCLSVCLSLSAFPHYCMDPEVTWTNGRRCPQVVHCWADLQSVHRFRCHDNIALNAKYQRVLVLALCLVQKQLSLVYASPACSYRLENQFGACSKLVRSCFGAGLFGNAMNLALHRHCSNDDDDLTYYSSAIEYYNITVLTKKLSKISILNTGS